MWKASAYGGKCIHGKGWSCSSNVRHNISKHFLRTETFPGSRLLAQGGDGRSSWSRWLGAFSIRLTPVQLWRLLPTRHCVPELGLNLMSDGLCQSPGEDKSSLYTQIVKNLNSLELYLILGHRNAGALGLLGKPKLGRRVSEFQVQRRVLLSRR